MNLRGNWLLVFLGVLPSVLLSQTSLCYVDKFLEDEPVFTRIQINASFKGGVRAFQTFLIKNIDHSKIISQLTHSQTVYADTAMVKFIITKKGTMSNLTVKNTNSDVFQKEIEEVFKKSSCHWVPGNYSGRPVNGWYQYDIYYRAKIRYGTLNISVDFKYFDYPPDEKG